VERRPDRAERIGRNARALGVGARVQVVVGASSAALSALPSPGAAFIGGGIAEPGLLAACRDALPREGRCVANAVTLEGEAALLAAFAEAGGALRRLSVAQAVPVGGLTGWRPAMPITQWVWTKP
jgi:precorrin-6Y C5,15-methyltransferase (decarboxylating)